MSAQNPKNTAASVRQRLFNRSREESQEFQLVLTRYALERLIFRLSLSSYADKFVLKGAMLFYVWNPTAGAYRPTRDLDFLMRGKNSVEILGRFFARSWRRKLVPMVWSSILNPSMPRRSGRTIATVEYGFY